MKTIMMSLSFVLLMMLGFSSFANKVMITGEPIVLEQRGDVYYVPSNYTSTGSYTYITLGDTKRVCYFDKQPTLASLDMVTINVDVGGTTAVWNCYEYNADYFEITP